MKKIILTALILNLFFFLQKSNAQGTWSNLGSGITPRPLGVLALCADTVNNVLYAGGAFDTAGSVQQNALAKWDGTKWDTTATISSGIEVYALIMYHGYLIIGFSNGHIGEYDGDTLTYLPGFNAAAYCFYIYNDTLYAGGIFTKSGNTTLNYIGKWNGIKWLPVDEGFSFKDCCVEISAMTEYNGELIASGTFDSAGSIAATSIAAYDGNNWKSLGVNLNMYGTTPFNGTLGVYKNKLYVAGSFDSLNSIYTPAGIADWDGTSWDTVLSNTSSMTIQANSNVAMTTFDGYLFISGNYNNQVPYKYNVDSVSTVDSGIGGGSYINAMVAWNGSLYVGGNFGATVEETKSPTLCIARWTPDSTATGIKKLSINNELISVYPNPTSNQLTFNSSNRIEQVQIENVLGQSLIEQNYFTPQPPKGGVRIDVSALPQGIYFYRLTNSDLEVVTGKFVKE